jgi:hypothetical protein
MKRSEAIEIIESSYYHQMGTYGEEVLSALEEAGMMPRWYEKTYTDHLGASRKEYKTGWEPEDDR